MERLPADLLIKEPKKKETPSTVAIALAIVSVAVTSLLIIFGLSQKAISKKPATRPALKSHQSDVELSPLKAVGKNSRDQLSNYQRGAARPTVESNQSTISRKPLLGHYDSNTGSSVTFDTTTTLFESGNRTQFGTPDRRSFLRNPYDADSISPAHATNTNSSRTDLDSSATSLRQHRASDTFDTSGSQTLPVDAKVDGVVVGDKEIATQSNAGLAGAVPAAYEAAQAPTTTLNPAVAAQVPQQRTRVDYLAGLVALCSILVATTHFVLTFAPSTVMEYIDQHYVSEFWARRTIEPFFFNNIWTGLFFTTSTRFLTTGYLRKGDLKFIAEKTVCRTPRFMIPIVSVILFEYFMMDVGAVTYLEYLPSITWSPWPSTSVYPNFGWFLNETLQLIYLIPNAAPQLTWNYCTGRYS